MNRIKIKTTLNKTEVLHIEVLGRFLVEDDFIENPL
jgi:hypothetical protein